MAAMRAAGGGERGAVLVLFALFAPVMVAFLIFVIDVDNWYEHQRHLQVQADSAALAAATAFVPYACTDNTIYATAGQYGGAASVTGPNGSQVGSTTPLYNAQVGSTTQPNIHELINSKTFYKQPSTSLPQTPDDTSTSPPCETPSGQVPMIDVKMTETNLPWFFNPLNVVPFINAQGRISILQQTTTNNVEALAVADSAPVAATAYFVNEDVSPGSAGWILASTKLCKEQAPAANGDAVWDNSGGVSGSTYSDPSCQSSPPSPLPVTVNKSHIGVVVALSGNKSDTTCGHPYVQCFDDSSTTGPSLLHIQGYSLAGSGTIQTPLARQVKLTSPPGTCTDAYFSNSSTSGTNCTVSVKATIDYGSTNTNGVTVTPVVGGTTESANALTPGTKSGTAIQWTGTISLQAAGSNRIDLDVHCTKNKSGPCGANTTDFIINDVQRSYASSTSSSGTIDGAWISEVGAGGTLLQSQDADSFEVCESNDNNSCTHNLAVTVDVGSTLQNTTSVSAPPTAIRIGTSQSDVVECPGVTSSSGFDYRLGLSQGCAGPFAVNTSDLSCSNPTAVPYDCIDLVSGTKEGPISQGLCTRITLQSCGAGVTPPSGLQYYCRNNWSKWPNLPANDSRLIELFVMPYGSTDANGNPLTASGYVPIVNLAEFYVTGFDKDTCASDDGAPSGAANNAWVVGHFIKYVQPSGTGSGSGACVLSQFGNCIAVFTK
jgi:Flp pilus assembly protein TadG